MILLLFTVNLIFIEARVGFFLCMTGMSEYMQRFFLTMVYIAVYTIDERKVIIMMTAKVFENGRSQAIRLPKECRFTSDEVMVNKIGDL